MNHSVKQGVILAAGRGSRIFPLSSYYPKTLLPVFNKPVMQYQIEAMQQAGISEIIIVVGNHGKQIKHYFKNGKKFNVNIKYVVDSEPEGIASSLFKAKNLIEGSFAVFLGDIFMDKVDLSGTIKKLIELDADGIVIAKRETDPQLVKRNFAVVMDKNQRIIKVVEKPKVPPSLLKGYGLYLFNRKIFDAIETTPRSALRNEYEITDSIQTLIDMGAKLFCDVWDLWDVNLSYPLDLLECNLRMLEERKIESLVAADAIVGEKADVKRSVIGKGTKIPIGIKLEQCLVLDGVEIKGKGDFYRKIFTGQSVLSV